MKKSLIYSLFAAIILVLGACSSDGGESTGSEKEMDHSEMDHSEMEHTQSGEVPEGLKEAENPKYEVGSEVILKEGHMKGMKGAKAKVTGAYDTAAYIVSYEPTTGGERVTDHKWVIQEEIKEAGDTVLEAGTKVTLEADHMEGMKGAAAEIESGEQTVVYMVDYTPTDGGEEVKNHKWVTEDELEAAE
ncbi:YdhK family protein [Bacillus massiliglaciei]|uniref:YdhK family protein n=1 Tax=Bacillus massiliglaciei TaxID=1816693 RepID=UPI000A46B3C3|nr:YdhK family protein [Bacillus massiliglaciei]